MTITDSVVSLNNSIPTLNFNDHAIYFFFFEAKIDVQLKDQITNVNQLHHVIIFLMGLIQVPFSQKAGSLGKLFHLQDKLPGMTFYRELVSASLQSWIFEPEQSSPHQAHKHPTVSPQAYLAERQLLLTLCSGVWSHSCQDETSR